jgi:putative tricarboxylic transport membrane protein
MAVLCLCVIGAYSMRGSVFDIGLMIGFGLFGFVCRKLTIPLAPMVLTLVLAPLMERSLRQSLEMSQGSLSILVERPLSLGLLLTALIVLWLSTRGALRAVRASD